MGYLAVLAFCTKSFLMFLAGTGKSVVIKHIASSGQRMKILATTGMAAQIVGGNTVHQFFGVNNPSATTDQVVTLSMQDSVLRQKLE